MPSDVFQLIREDGSVLKKNDPGLGPEKLQAMQEVTPKFAYQAGQAHLCKPGLFQVPAPSPGTLYNIPVFPLVQIPEHLGVGSENGEIHFPVPGGECPKEIADGPAGSCKTASDLQGFENDVGTPLHILVFPEPNSARMASRSPSATQMWGRLYWEKVKSWLHRPRTARITARRTV